MIDVELEIHTPGMAAWPGQHIAAQLRALLDAYKEVHVPHMRTWGPSNSSRG